MNFIRKLKDGFKLHIEGKEAEKIMQKIFTSLANDNEYVYPNDFQLEGWIMDSTMEDKNART